MDDRDEEGRVPFLRCEACGAEAERHEQQDATL
jgi:translation initiation factor 2 beta subunit (eIF-2beta)/eIF-5